MSIYCMLTTYGQERLKKTVVAYRRLIVNLLLREYSVCFVSTQTFHSESQNVAFLLALIIIVNTSSAISDPLQNPGHS